MELGYLRLKVEEVARNKTMKDQWPLLGASKGDIALTLTFQPIIFDKREMKKVSEAGRKEGMCAGWLHVDPRAYTHVRSTLSVSHWRRFVLKGSSPISSFSTIVLLRHSGKGCDAPPCRPLA